MFEHQEAHFGSLKHANDLLVYQGFMIPRNHQAGMQGILKEHLRASFLDSISLDARSNSCGVFNFNNNQFLRITLRIPTGHDFCVISARAHTQHIQNGGFFFVRNKSSFFPRKRVPGPKDFFI